MVDVGCARPATFFDAGHCRSHACCCATTGALAGRESADSVGLRSWHCLLDRLMTCPLSCRLFRAVYTGTRQVRVSSTVEVPLIQFTARVVDILLYNRDWYTAFIKGVMAAVNGFFDAFCVIFRAPPVVPELSASFSSFRALTPMSARGQLVLGCR